MSNIDFKQWDSIAVNPEDKLVAQFLKFGFPAGYNGPIPTPTTGNHPSASHHSTDVAAHICKEIQQDAMLDSFSAPHFHPWCQTNPFWTRLMKDSPKGRVLM